MLRIERNRVVMCVEKSLWAWSVGHVGCAVDLLELRASFEVDQTA